MQIAGLPKLSGAAARKYERLLTAAEGAQHGSPAATALAEFMNEWKAGAAPAALAEKADLEERAAEEAAQKAETEARAAAEAEVERVAKAQERKAKSALTRGLNS